MPVTTGVALVGGVVAGSAAGAAMHRWPAGATLGAPRRSRCSDCGGLLRARDLVPVVSWVMLRGACRMCGARIDPRLPMIELASAIVAVGIVRAHGFSLVSLVLMIGSVAVLVAAFIDAEHLIVPDRLTLPLALLGLAAIPIVAGWERAAVVGAWAIGVPVTLRILSAVADAAGWARPVGGGDIKLLVGVLALAGIVPHGPGAVLLGAVVLAGIVALLGLASGLLARGTRIAFAPFVAVSFLVVAVAPERSSDILVVIGGMPWSA